MADRHGFGGHEQALRSQIELLIPRTLPLSLLPFRLNEFMSIQNIDPFSAYFNVKECFTGNPDAALLVRFRRRLGRGQNTLTGSRSPPSAARKQSRSAILGRPVVVYQAPIRLIATRWIYDAATKTLFTSDMFTHTWRDQPDGPWIIQDGDDDPTDFDHVRSFLLNTRYWWLEGVDTAKLRKGIDKILASTTSRRSRPATAASCAGRRRSKSTSRLSTTCCSSLDKTVAMSRYVGRDEER